MERLRKGNGCRCRRRPKVRYTDLLMEGPAGQQIGATNWNGNIDLSV